MSVALRTYLTLFIAGSAAFSMSTLFSAMKPVMLTRYVEQVQTSDTLASLIAATPFVGIAAAALIAPWFSERFSLRALVCGFGALLVGIEVISALQYQTVALVLPTQFAGGIAVGVLMGATSQRIALTPVADQLFGMVDMVAVLLMSFMVTGVGMAVNSGGVASGYLLAALLSAIFAVAMLSHRSGRTQSPVPMQARPPLHIGVRELSVVAMGVLFVTSSGMGFAYMFTMARDLGMDYAVAGQQIGALLFVSAFACAAGGWCSARFGPYRPLACAYVACALGWWLATHTESPLVFIAALVPAVFALQFSFPVLVALSGSLDDQGRWAAIATPLLTSGFAWAAIAAGQVVERAGITALALATAAGMGVCLLLLAGARSPAPDPAS